jgi:hypothetical protein
MAIVDEYGPITKRLNMISTGKSHWLGFMAVLFLFSAIPAFATPVKLSGKWTVQGNRSSVLMQGKITNQGSYGSGDLRLELWASKSPYRGKAMPAFKMVVSSYPPLEPGAGYNVRQVTSYRRPPQGLYYMVVILKEAEERGDLPAGWPIRSYVSGKKKVRF